MLASLLLLGAAAYAHIVQATNVSLFPGALGTGANLQGEIIGTGGQVGTTYVLSGETSGIAFTLTLAEDSSLVAEKVTIPTLSLDLMIGCSIEGASAICQNVVGSGSAASTLALTTLPFSPIAVPVSTSGVAPSTVTASSATATSSQVSTPATSAAASSSFSAVPTSSLASASASASVSVSAASSSTSIASIASASASESPSSTSDAPRSFAFAANLRIYVPLLLILVAATTTLSDFF